MLDITHCTDETEVCAALSQFSHPELFCEVTLVGDVDLVPDTRNIVTRCREGFRDLIVVDHTRMLKSGFVKEMARENTVHGIVVRRLLELSAATGDEHKLHIYELTLRELLARFEMMQGKFL